MVKSLAERDIQSIWHPYTQMKLTPAPIPIIRANGVYLEDDSGNKYIDAISSWWVNIHGHAHPYLAQKIYEQALKLEHVIFAGFTHQPAIELAERLLVLLPHGMRKIFYSDNGSTAVEVALKMCIQYWNNKGEHLKRKRMLALTNSYHGDTFGSMSVSERGPFTLAFQDYLFEVDFVDVGAPAIHEIEKYACFIYEPLVQGAGGMKMHDAETLNSLIKKCKQHNVLCIADEVMTGFGRTGKLFASDHLKEKPDIICLSKGLTGGMMALGVTACTSEIYDAFLSEDRTKTFFHGHSYTANPLACTAGTASLDLLLKQECIGNIARIAQQHKQFIEQHPHLNARSTGTILAFEVPSNGVEGYLNNIGSIIHKKALQQGVLLRPLGNTVYIMPPYCITGAELDSVYACIKSIVDENT